MVRTRAVWTALIVAVVFVSVAAVWALFHGYFDRGKFEIKEATWSSGHALVAMVAERSDHQALNGDEYFVVIADHILSTRELKRAYYSDSVVFAAANECVSVQWNRTNNLTVACRDSTINAMQINARRRQAGNVTISYVNISDIDSVAK
jgi:hypothetical protein